MLVFPYSENKRGARKSVNPQGDNALSESELISSKNSFTFEIRDLICFSYLTAIIKKMTLSWLLALCNLSDLVYLHINKTNIHSNLYVYTKKCR
jgi:hypothetical protein